MSAGPANGSEERKSPLKEIIQPFKDLLRAPRALWGINLAYVIEGMVYFGMLGYLSLYFSDFVFQSVDGANEEAHHMVMILTAGITISMFFLGRVADTKGVRFALLLAFLFMFCGRGIWSSGSTLFGLDPVQPGVFAGDKVDLHITKVDTKNKIKTITDSTLIKVEEKGIEPGRLSRDLAAGEGQVPEKSMESRLVSLGSAKVLRSKNKENRNLWEIEYGSKPVRAWLSTPKGMVCKGAQVSIRKCYVSAKEFKLNPEDEKAKLHYILRTTWNDDYAKVDVSGCSDEEKETLESEKEDRAAKDVEGLLKTKKRREAEPLPELKEAPTEIDLADLRAADDGTCNYLLKGAYVSYVRGGGYFLQNAQNGPAMFVFVDPFWSPLQIITLLGMVLVVIGYGMYQPAAYAGVRKFTNPKTAAMGFAMLYALMNLGGWFPTFAFLLRNKEHAGLGISGTFWVYTFFTGFALIATAFILTRKTAVDAERIAKEETEKIKAEEEKAKAEEGKPEEQKPEKAPDTEKDPETVGGVVKPHMWLLWLGIVALVLFKAESPYFHHPADSLWRWILAGALFLAPAVIAVTPRLKNWVIHHPLEDSKFAFFIFALIPVQTLFTYNWLVLPAYIQRSVSGWLGKNFEVLANANPLLIFLAVPIITAMTQKANVYKMMIWGTFIMAAPSFLLCLGPEPHYIIAYIFIMTIGEAMWQPRFLQYAAEIAPEGRTGEYMGVAQLPWFLTKILVPLLYSGWMMDEYCPLEGEKNTEFMWFIYGLIAVSSTVLLLIAKNWVGKDFKTKADG